MIEKKPNLSFFRCETFSGDGINVDRDLDDTMCMHEFKPIDHRRCFSPCVGECVVSEWTPWSRCQQVC